MHGTGIDDAGWDRRLARLQEFVRFDNELRLTACTAEIIFSTVLLAAVFCLRRFQDHSANGIDRGRRTLLYLRPILGALMAGIIMRTMPVLGFPILISRPGQHGHDDPLDYLTPGTLWGYIVYNMRKDIKDSCLKRLNRIEGQVRGLARMVEEDRYCIDIVTQISAVRAALRRVEEEILRDHVGHCVEHAISSGNRAEQRRKIAELMEVVTRAER